MTGIIRQIVSVMHPEISRLVVIESSLRNNAPAMVLDPAIQLEQDPFYIHDALIDVEIPRHSLHVNDQVVITGLVFGSTNISKAVSSKRRSWYTRITHPAHGLTALLDTPVTVQYIEALPDTYSATETIGDRHIYCTSEPSRYQVQVSTKAADNNFLYRTHPVYLIYRDGIQDPDAYLIRRPVVNEENRRVDVVVTIHHRHLMGVPAQVLHAPLTVVMTSPTKIQLAVPSSTTSGRCGGSLFLSRVASQQCQYPTPSSYIFPVGPFRVSHVRLVSSTFPTPLHRSLTLAWSDMDGSYQVDITGTPEAIQRRFQRVIRAPYRHEPVHKQVIRLDNGASKYHHVEIEDGILYNYRDRTVDVRYPIKALVCSEDCDWITHEGLVYQRDGDVFRISSVALIIMDRQGIVRLGTASTLTIPGTGRLIASPPLQRGDIVMMDRTESIGLQVINSRSPHLTESIAVRYNPPVQVIHDHETLIIHHPTHSLAVDDPVQLHGATVHHTRINRIIDDDTYTVPGIFGLDQVRLVYPYPICINGHYASSHSLPNPSPPTHFYLCTPELALFTVPQDGFAIIRVTHPVSIDTFAAGEVAFDPPRDLSSLCITYRYPDGEPVQFTEDHNLVMEVTVVPMIRA